MPLVSAKALLDRARVETYAVPAFCCVNLETIEATVECAQEERSGVIVQFHPDFFKYADIGSLSALSLYLAQRSPVPIAIGLDHGRTLYDVIRCLRNGFTSVMIDLSSLPLADNIQRVRQVVEICHPLGITVEAAIGRMSAGKQQTSADMADACEAAELVKGTGVDALAPAVGNVHGTAHGEQKANPHLDFSRIREISDATGAHIVLHGGSSISEEDLRGAIASGISKVVFYSDLARAFNVALADRLAGSSLGSNLISTLSPARKAFKEVARDKIRSLGASGRY